MKKNKIILIVALMLIIIAGFSYFVVSSFNSHEDLNVTNNNTNKSITNSSVDVNKSSNMTNDILENDTSYSKTSSDSYSSYSGYSSSKSKSDEFTASDAQNVVKNYLGGVDHKDISELKIGKPTFKDSDGDWLVPLYDKKTGKFVHSVYAGEDGMTHGGVETYKNYKRVISGKKPKEYYDPNLIRNR